MDSEHNSETITGEKVVIIGDTSVGKSSIITRFTQNTFSLQCPTTIGVDNYIKEVGPDTKKVKLLIWDTAGQERFRALAKSYYNNAKCIIMVFDITNKKSFEKLENWKNEVFQYTHEGVLIVLIGNKKDLQSQREVGKDDIEEYVKKNEFFYMETSAKDEKDEGINKVFEYVGENISQVEARMAKDGKVVKGEGVVLDKKEGEKDEGCKC